MSLIERLDPERRAIVPGMTSDAIQPTLNSQQFASGLDGAASVERHFGRLHQLLRQHFGVTVTYTGIRVAT